MARQLYGESYGGIASQELARDSARDQRYFQSLAARRAVEQMNFQRQQAEQENAFRVAQLSANLAAQREAAGRDFERYRDTRQDRLLDSFLENKRFYDQLGFNKSKLTSDETIGKARIQERELDDATRAITEGSIRSENDIDSLFPNLDATQRRRLKVMAKSVDELEDQDIAASEAAAKAANAQLKLGTDAKRSRLGGDIDKIYEAYLDQVKGPNLPRWMGGGGTEGTLNREAAAKMMDITGGQPMFNVNLEGEELSTLLNNILKNRSIAESVAFDDKTGQFVPLLRRRGTPGAAAPVAGPTIPAAVAAPGLAPAVVQPTINRPRVPAVPAGATTATFDDEAAARAAGFGSGAIVLMWDPQTNRYRKARLR